MAMTVRKAEQAFERTIKRASRLLEVDDYADWPAGAPARQQALYCGVVVLAVGAWQGVVEDVAVASYEVTKRRARQAKLPLGALGGPDVAKFNTPNGKKTRQLFDRAGLRLPKTWTVPSAGATLNAQQAWEVAEAWLQVRHAVAHGFSFSESDQLMNLLGNHSHVTNRVLTGGEPGRGQGRVLRYEDTEGCIELFTGMAAVVRKAALKHKASS